MKNKKAITKRFVLSSSICTIIYTFIYLLVMYFLYLVTSLRVWDENDKLYQILNISKKIVIPLWMFGVIIILFYFVKKSYAYIEAISEASKNLTIKNKKNIELPTELENIQDAMNSIKSEAIENMNIANETERKNKDLIVCLAHDLKTPLTSIIGYLDILLKDDSISEEDRVKYLNIVNEKANSLETLINELFRVAKMNSENYKLDFQKIDLSFLIQQVVDDFYPILEKNKKEIKLDLPSEKVYICADSENIYRVINNLVKNAISYSLPKDIINIELSVKESVIIKFKNHCSKFEKKDEKLIFDRFYRCDTSRTSKGGSGLGLSIAKEIIEKHNGTIEAKYSKGLITFTIKLPILRKN